MVRLMANVRYGGTADAGVADDPSLTGVWVQIPLSDPTGTAAQPRPYTNG